MIPFFRRIRKKFADDNKPIKYLRYAIGEIILVVIGILIAIQVNTIYKNQSLKKSNNILLSRMLNEIANNSNRLNYLEYNFETETQVYVLIPYFHNISQLDSSLSIINNSVTKYNLDFLVQNSSFNFSSYNMYYSVYEEMINTGRLYNIGSDSLVNEINKYYNLIDRENNYNNRQIQDVLNLQSACKYGWNNFIQSYSLDKELATNNNQWLFDVSSKNYIDYKTYLDKAKTVLMRSRDRIKSINQMSEKLTQLINNTVSKT